jgi:hypothetical protein
MKRQDEAYFGSLREAVLARDGYRCRGAALRVEGNVRSPCIIVSWRLPVGTDDLAVSGVPCQGGADEDGALGDDATLLELRREQHPGGHEQVMLAFNARGPATYALPLAFDDPRNETAKRGE